MTHRQDSQKASAGALIGTALIVFLLGLLAYAWVLMIALGGVHNHAIDAVPAVGYRGSLALSLLIYTVGRLFRPAAPTK